MKTAICMSGYSEPIRFVKDNLKEYFDKYIENYHIYAYVPPSDQAWKLKEYFPNITVRVVEDQHIEEMGIRGNFKTGVQKWLQQINGWKQSNLMRKESGVDYDFVIRCRPDIQFKSPWFNLENAEQDRIYIPHFHHHGGINDRFCIAPPNLIDNYMNIIDEAIKNPNEVNYNAESFLKKCLKKTNTPIELVSIYFDRVRSKGKVIIDTGFESINYPQELIRKGTTCE